MTQPAFVELDVEKLTRDQLVLMGMKMALDEWVDELAAQAEMQGPNIMAARVLSDLAKKVGQRRDTLAVVLTRDAVRHRTGRLENLKAEV